MTVPDHRRGWRAALALLGFAVLCYGAGAVGGWLTAQSVASWYPTLRKPDWTPPGQAIAIVWNVLYGLMALAGWLVWRRRGLTGARGAFLLFTLQLVLNVTWSALFFALRAPLAAFVELVLLEAAVVATLVAFARHERWAGLLFAPYAAWVAFAGALNLAIVLLNRA